MKRSIHLLLSLCVSCYLSAAGVVAMHNPMVPLFVGWSRQRRRRHNHKSSVAPAEEDVVCTTAADTTVWPAAVVSVVSSSSSSTTTASSSSNPTPRRRVVPHLSPRAQRLLFRYLHGSTPQTMRSLRQQSSSLTQNNKRPRVSNVRQALTTALDELDVLRREVDDLRQLVRGHDTTTTTTVDDTDTTRTREQKRYQTIAHDVEAWADRMLRQTTTPTGDDDDDTAATAIEWKDIRCTKMLRGRYNADDRTETSLTWMVDSRTRSNDDAAADDTTLWPCLRIRSTIDAPLADVSNYLSQASHSSIYNALLTDFRRLSTIGPQAQITMAQTPKILFVQPKTFLTFCAYRWRRKGQELVIVNEALDEFTAPASTTTSRPQDDDDDTALSSVKQVSATTDTTPSDTLTATAFCFRGATVLSQDRDDPQKTHICLIAHASPGRDVPAWACRTATHTLAAMEPYQLCYKLNQAVIQAVQTKKRREQQRGGGGGGSTMHVAEAAIAATAANSAEDSHSSGVHVATDGDDQPMKTAPMKAATLIDTTPPSEPPHKTTILMESTSAPQEQQQPAPVDLVVPESKRPVGIAHMGYACFWPNGAEDGDDDEQDTLPQAPPE